MATIVGRFRKLLGRCLALCGLILVIISLVLVFDIDLVYFQSTAIQTEGTVIEVRRNYRVAGGDHNPAWNPVVRFQVGPDGVEILGPITIGSSPYSVGEKVTVIYPNGRPDAGRVKSSTPVLLMPSVFGVAGVLCGLLGLYFVRLANRGVAASQSSENARLN